MSDLWLTPDEVAVLTALNPNSYKAQCRRLADMGVPFTANAIGRPLVVRSLFEKTMKPTRKAVQPNWDAMRT